jgi:hypothetical protein
MFIENPRNLKNLRVFNQFNLNLMRVTSIVDISLFDNLKMTTEMSNL